MGEENGPPLDPYKECEKFVDTLVDYVTRLAEQMADLECVAPDDECNHCLANEALKFVEENE